MIRKGLVKGACIILRTSGEWLWASESTTKIRIFKGSVPVFSDDRPAFLKRDVETAIKNAVVGMRYRHSRTAAQPGTISGVEVSVEDSSLSEIFFYNGEPLATSETRGRFRISAAWPLRSRDPGSPPQPAKVGRHSGSWHIEDPGQEVVTEGEGVLGEHLLLVDEYIRKGKRRRKQIMSMEPVLKEDQCNFDEEFRERLKALLERDKRIVRKRGATREIELRSDTEEDHEAAKLMQQAAQAFPDTWLDVADRIPLKVKCCASGRAGYDPKYANVEIPLEEVSTAAHEYTHHLQAVMPELDGLFQSLHCRRTRGEKLVRLYPDSTDDDQMGRKDKYADKYMGREYGDYKEIAPRAVGPAVEVITMAMQITLYGCEGIGVRHLVKKDPEMLDLVVGTLLYFDPEGKGKK